MYAGRMRDLERQLRISESKIDRMLEQVDPWALRARYRDAGKYSIFRRVNFGRFLWVGTALGGGQSSDPATISEVFRLLAKWAEDAEELFSLRGRGGDRHSILESHEYVRRLYSVETRFLWITEELIQAAVESTAVLKQGEIDWCKDLSERFRSYALTSSVYGGSDPAGGIRSDPLGIMSIMSVRPGELSDRKFGEVVRGRDPELRPFVQWQGSGETVEFWPPNLQDACLGVEVALFQSLDSSGFKKGDGFEVAVRRLLQDWLPEGRVLDGDATIPVDSSKDPLQTDLGVVYNNHVILVGEDKCYMPPRGLGDNNVEAELVSAGKQVVGRISALRGRHCLRMGKESWPADANMEGLVVTLQSCGLSIWNERELKESEFPSDVGIVTLHHLVLIASVCDSVTQFLAYLRFRREELGKGLVVTDELEILIWFYNRHRWRQKLPLLLSPESRGILLGHAIDHRAAYLLARPQRSPSGRRAWKNQLVRTANPVGHGK